MPASGSRKKGISIFNKKARQILELQSRVKELENVLCPFGQHDYIETGRTYDGGDPVYSREEWIVSCECRRCHKKIIKYEI